MAFIVPESLEKILLYLVIVIVSIAADNLAGDNSCDYLVEKHTVDCSSRNLTTVPVVFPNDTTSLILSWNSIREIGDKAFNSVPNLRSLSLRHNMLEHINGNAFEGLRHLAMLDLSHNNLNINSFPDVLFWPLSSLRTLDIGNNEFISRLPWKSLSVLTHLADLTIEGVENLNVSVDFMSNITELQTLRFKPCKMGNINNKTFLGFSKSGIQVLELDPCSINKINKDSFQSLASSLVNLTISRYDGTPLVSQPLNAVCGLTKLKKLHIQDFFAGQASEFSCLATLCLEELIIRNSGIYILDLTPFQGNPNATCLKRLDVSGNHLTERVYGVLLFIQVFPNLQICDLSFQVPLLSEERSFRAQKKHQTIRLPSTLTFLSLARLSRRDALETLTFQNATSLHTLDMAYLAFTTCHRGALLGLKNLKTLDFSGLKCDTGFNSTFFKELQSLKRLVFKDSFKESFTDDIFYSLTNLEELDLSRNNIGDFKTNLSALLLQQVNSLTSLNLAGNKLRTFPLALSDFKTLRNLNLRENLQKNEA